MKRAAWIALAWLVPSTLLCALVWFFGPMVAVAGVTLLGPVAIRATVVAVIAALGIVACVLTARRARGKAATEAIPDPREEAAALAARTSAKERDSMRATFRDALRTQARARGVRRGLFGGGLTRYALPWYLLLGASGSGKSTLLANSGLRFPLRDEWADERRGDACDFWFADDAVLIDTAGELATQGSGADAERWDALLCALRGARRRQPLNGVLVTVSVDELVHADDADRRAGARHLRQRLREVGERLGQGVPVYLLVTQCDGVPGFAEYFDDLGREAREQVLGTTFDEASIEQRDGLAARVREAFEALVQRLDARLVDRLQDERATDRRAALFGFPRAFAALGDATGRYVIDVFSGSRYEVAPMLRGVYFTSAAQGSNPVTRLMDSMAQHYDLKRSASTEDALSRGPVAARGGRSFFVTRLLRDVVIPEANLAGSNAMLVRARAWGQRAAWALGLAALGVGVAGWTTSYRANQQLIAAVDAAAADATAQQGRLAANAEDPLFVAPLLGTLHGAPAGVGERTSREIGGNSLERPVLAGIGLYQGHRLGDASEAAWRRVLHNQLLPRLLLQLEDRIKVELASDQPNSDLLYEALKIYLMFDTPARFDAADVRTWLHADWDHRYGRTQGESERAALNAGLEALLEGWPEPLPVRLDTKVVDAAREVLARTPPAMRAYRYIVAAVAESGVAPDIRLGEVSPELDRVLVRRSGTPIGTPLPGLYSYAGYHEGFKPALSRIAATLDAEKWVLGPRADRLPEARDLESLTHEVRARYMRDYIASWDALLDDLEITAFASVGHASELLGLLGGPRSPLVRVLELAERETTLTRPLEGGEVAGRLAERSMRSALDRAGRVGRLLNSADALPGGETLLRRDLTPVDEHYAALHRYVRADAGGRAPYERLTDEVDALYQAVHVIELSAEPLGAIRGLIKGQASNSIGKLDRLGARAPAPAGRFAVALAANARSLAAGDLKASLNAAWDAQGRRQCEMSIERRYPFDRGASSEVTLTDFVRFFGPGGTAASFFDENLAELTDTAATPWRSARRGQTAGVRLAPESLRQFERAAKIREAFFGGRSAGLRIDFEMTPVNMDAAIERFSLDLEGQALGYQHGPVRPTPLRWPGPGAHSVRIEMLPRVADGRSGAADEGPWAWFRLLDRSAMRATTDPERFELTFDVDGRQARFSLRADSTSNPFVLPALAEFRCPGEL